MTIEIKMPALSPTMTQGKLVRWLMQEGHAVEAGSLLFEIETDKALMEVESVEEGTLGKIFITAQDAVPVGEVVALILEEGEGEEQITRYLEERAASLEQAATTLQESVPSPQSVSSASTNIPATDAPQTASHAPAAQTPAVQTGAPGTHANAPSGAQSGAQPIHTSAPAQTRTASDSGPAHQTPAAQATEVDQRLKISPLARRMAQNHQIDLSFAQWHDKGTGPYGRIVAADVQKHLDKMAYCQATYGPELQQDRRTAGVTSGHTTAAPEPTELPLTPMRKVIAQRLQASKQEAPHFYLHLECQMDNLLAMRQTVNQAWTNAHPDKESPAPRLSVTHLLLKACGEALHAVPQANCIWKEGKILQHATTDVALAVAIPDGLLTPVIPDIHAQSLRELKETTDLKIQKSRSGKLSARELQGGVMTLSNLGMYQMDSFLAILNPPHSSILGVGAMKKKPYCDTSDAIAVGTFLQLTLSVDHRVLDGAVAATFFQKIRTLLENPWSLIL